MIIILLLGNLQAQFGLPKKKKIKYFNVTEPKILEVPS